MNSQPQDERPTEDLLESVMEAIAQALEDAQAAGEPVADIAAAMADGEAIKAEIVEFEGEGRLVVITVEPEETAATPEATEATEEAEAQPEDSEPAQKPARKGRGKKGAASTEDVGRKIRPKRRICRLLLVERLEHRPIYADDFIHGNRCPIGHNDNPLVFVDLFCRAGSRNKRPATFRPIWPKVGNCDF